MGIPALDWGLEKEPFAHKEYKQTIQKKTHVNLKIEQAGLLVNPLHGRPQGGGGPCPPPPFWVSMALPPATAPF